MQDEKLTIYIIEKDDFVGKKMAYHLNLNPEWACRTFPSLDNFHQQQIADPDIFIIGGCQNISELVARVDDVKEHYRHTRILCIADQDKKCTANLLLDPAVFDVVMKDELWLETLWHHTRNVHEEVKLRRKVEHLQLMAGDNRLEDNQIIGQSDSMQPIFQLMDKAAQSDITVSIVGDTGTGKELVAKHIHSHSSRKNHPMIAVNVSAIPKDLIESEFFGYEKGSFTGATTRRKGKFEQANGGTLFLDEIADMDLNMQAKLLRVLQEREFTRIGGYETVKTDVRIICATHKHLADEVQRGNFREDLYYRLLGLTIAIPPLCNRGQDIIELANFFIKQFARQNRKGVKQLHHTAQQKLLNYSFPGNIRELKAIIDLAMVMANQTTIYAEDISFGSRKASQNFLAEERTLDEYIELIIQHFIEKYDHKIHLVAEKLNIGKSTIYRMLQNKKR